MDGKHRWRVQNTRMQTGYVPSNYVRKEKPSIFDSIKKKVSFLLKKGNNLFHIFFYPRWRVAGTKAQEAELSHPQTQVLCTVFPLPLIQVLIILPLIQVGKILIFFYELIVKCNSLLCVNSNKWVFSSQYNKHHYIFNPPSPPHSPPPQIWKLLILILKHHFFFNTPSPPQIWKLFNPLLLLISLLLRYEIIGQPATNHYRKLGANILGNCEIQLPGKKVACRWFGFSASLDLSWSFS